MPLQGFTALVTGASRGLGLGFVKALAGAGAEVWAVAEHSDELERACATVTAHAPLHPVIADLRRRSDAGRIMAAIQKRGALSVLVNNAAVQPLKSLSDTDDSTWDAALAVNLTAPFVLTRLALPLMRERGGSVINVSVQQGGEILGTLNVLDREGAFTSEDQVALVRSFTPFLIPALTKARV